MRAHALRKLTRRAALLLAGLVVIGGILYAAGLRIVQYGSGGIGVPSPSR